MKKTIAFIALLGGCWGFLACEKNDIAENDQAQLTDPTKANLKIINAYTSNVPAGVPGVGVTRFYAYQGTDKLTGNALAAPSSFPSSAAYALVSTGSKPLYFLLDRKVNNIYAPPMVGDTAFRTTLDLKAGAYYTAFLVGVAPTQEVIVSEDDLTPPANKSYKLRFANLIPSPVRGISVYSSREKKLIASNITYKQISNFIELPVPAINDTLLIYEGTNLVKPLFFGILSPGNKRIYTLYAQGRTGFRNEAVSSYTNF